MTLSIHARQTATVVRRVIPWLKRKLRPFFKTTLIQKSLDHRDTSLDSSLSFFLSREVTRPSYECSVFYLSNDRKTAGNPERCFPRKGGDTKEETTLGDSDSRYKAEVAPRCQQSETRKYHPRVNRRVP